MGIFKTKVAIIGRNAVGKTSCANRFTRNFFAQRYIATLGCDYYIKTVELDGSQYKLVIHDIGGQVEFDYLRKKHLENSDIVIIMFALDTPGSYDLSEFIEDLSAFKHRPLVAIAGNKLDTVDRQSLDLHVPERHSREQDAPMYLVSAKENVNVRQMFMDMLERFAARRSNR